jgi:hypothetical protein
MGKPNTKNAGNGDKPPPPAESERGCGCGEQLPVNPDSKRRWELCRQVIEHEDNLVNHRLTWFLIINGFLMTACGASLGTLATADPTRFQWAVVGFLTANCLVGLVISALATPAILAAYRHVGLLESWWLLPAEKAKDYGLAHFPPLIGAVDDAQSLRGAIVPEENPYGFDVRFWDHHRARSDAKAHVLSGWEAISKLAETLKRKPPSDASKFILERLPKVVSDEIKGWNPAVGRPSRQTQLSLLEGINRIILGDSIADENCFKNIRWRFRTRRFQRSMPDGASFAGLNRRILEDAFRGILARCDRGFLRLNGAERYPLLFSVFWSLGLVVLIAWVLIRASGLHKPEPYKSITLKQELPGYALEVLSLDRQDANAVLKEVKDGTFLTNLWSPPASNTIPPPPAQPASKPSVPIPPATTKPIPGMGPLPPRDPAGVP